MSEYITKHFKKSEVDCNCQCGGMPSIAFMDKVETLRVMCNFPFNVGSCARCATHNANIGGAKKSDHIFDPMRPQDDERGAIDIKVHEFEYERRYKIVKYAIGLGFDVIEVCDAHIHLGIRGLGSGILFTGKSR
jgi:hypothetical protein